MENYENNLKVLKYVPNYYKIIEEEFAENDAITGKLIQIFEELVEKTNIDSKDDIKLLTKFNKTIERYFSDVYFRKELSTLIIGIKIKKEVNDVIKYIAKELNKVYEKYIDGYTRNLYIPRWI